MIKLGALRFETSAFGLDGCPGEPWPEVAVSGRSNVGKSSLINRLAGRRQLAKVSQKPGKTRSLNFFRWGEASARLVDLPGYGYAKVSKAEQDRWRRFMTEYLEGRGQLAGLVQLVDCRHAPSTQDVQMIEWLRHAELPFLLVMTKADKLGRGALGKSEAALRRSLELGAEAPLQRFSSTTGEGKREVMAWIVQVLEAWKDPEER
jgi:GTP-binding protein